MRAVETCMGLVTERLKIGQRRPIVLVIPAKAGIQ
jgi:hypothetical protein